MIMKTHKRSMKKRKELCENKISGQLSCLVVYVLLYPLHPKLNFIRLILGRMTLTPPKLLYHPYLPYGYVLF